MIGRGMERQQNTWNSKKGKEVKGKGIGEGRMKEKGKYEGLKGESKRACLKGEREEVKKSGEG